MIPLDLLALGVLLFATFPGEAQEPTAPPSNPPEAQEPAEVEPFEIPDGLPASTLDKLRALEAQLRIRNERIREADRFLKLERLILDENKRQRQIGVVPQRQIQLIEVRVGEAESQLASRESERDQVAQMLSELKRRISAGSPEPDADEVRAAIAADLRSSEARLQAKEARLRAAELQVESELASQENFFRATRDGLASPMAMQQSFFRVHDARIWRDMMEAEREAARVALERDRRRLNEFDRGDREVEVTLNDLASRVRWLENEVQILRDEVYFLEETRRQGRSAGHERFGSRDR